MSTALIIAIVVAVVLIILLIALVFSPQARVKRRERELGQRREQAVEQHSAEAEERNLQAQEAEKRAQIAQADAQRQRAEAELHQTRAQVHEQGRADHELIEDHERDRFAGTAAVPEEGERRGTPAGGGADQAGGGRVSPAQDAGVRDAGAVPPGDGRQVAPDVGAADEPRRA